jgi:elongation factor G
VGTNIPKNYIPAIRKAFIECCQKGLMSGHKVVGLRMTLVDGAHHEVDSSDWAFTQATQAAFEDVFEDGTWVLLEPIMNVEVTAPEEFQGSCVSAMSQRNGVIKCVSGNDNWFTLEAEAPLNDMFGYSSDLRSKTQGKGEYSMEYTRYSPASADLQDKIIKQYKSNLAKEEGTGGKKKTKN